MSNLEFIQKAKSWDEIFSVLKTINATDILSAGKAFEVFCKHYLIHSGEFKTVQLLAEVDRDLLKRLNIEPNDHGCDLVLTTNDGKFAAVQCKFTSDQENKTLSWTGDRLSSFLAASTVADIRIIFTNASGVAPAVIRKAQEKQYIQYDFQHLNELNETDINSIYKSMIGSKLRKVFFTPRSHQKEALNKVINGFKKTSRGKLILPCGAGKTLTALWIKEKLNPTKTLVLVPSLSLLRQFKNDWQSQGKFKSDYFCVCSEKDISGPDSQEMNIYEIGGNVTTDPKEIRQLLSLTKSQIVYATYQSSPRIADAMAGTKLSFDLVICDEAHRTSGEKASAFATILDNKKIKASRRLFMTATPRIVSDKVKDKLGNEKYKYLADMNDEALFGQEFFYMNFGDAIKKNPPFLSDYKIIAVGVTNEEVKSWLKERRFAKGTTVNDIAHNYALEKVMNKYKANHAITFHSRVGSAQEFQARHNSMFDRVDTFHVNGKQSSSERAYDLKKFKDVPKAVITNARCLTEGVDVPAIDMVYFCDPKSSKIDIVQATGRALRIHKGKKLGYIVVPLLHKKGANTEKTIEEGNYKVLIQVVRAMADQDSRIEEEIKSIKYGLGKQKPHSRKIEIDFGSKSRIELLGFERKLKESIFTEIISRAVVQWKPFELAREYVHTLNLKSTDEWFAYCQSGEKPDDIPVGVRGIYKNQGWISMGDWLGTGRIASQHRVFRPFHEAKAFVQKLKFKNGKSWRDYSKSAQRPNDIPVNPENTYRHTGWAGMGDWLGTGFVATHEREYRSFKDARYFVQGLGLKSNNAWRIFAASPEKPIDIPSAPDRIYKNSGWKGYGDWLGTGSIPTREMMFRSFSEARSFVHRLKLTNSNDWMKYASSQNRPSDIPFSPAKTYKNQGWISMGDWLGSGVIANKGRSYRSFKEARRWVHKLKFKNGEQWKHYCKSGDKPFDIPAKPERIYKIQGWISMGDWLGTGIVANRGRSYRSFKEARQWVHKLGLKKQIEWNAFSKSDKKPNDIPTNPQRAYKSQGWISMGDWLGTGNLRPRDIQYRSFTKSRSYVHSLKLKSNREWRIYIKSGKKPSDIPAGPDQFYKHKGWISWKDWLRG
jgi:superfamily II DNA or RNA helicase